MGKGTLLYFRIVRWCAALIQPAKYIESMDAVPQPCVFLCRHKNMQGPIYSMSHLWPKCRPWILYAFCDRREFARQMYGYTLTTRLGWPKWIARPAAPFFAFFVVPLITAMRSIPVYRHDGRIRETFRQSLEALEAGDNLMIYPDIEYTSRAETVSDVYDGFFMLERLYRRKTGRHIPFVPVHIDMAERSIRYGEAVLFGDGDYIAEKTAAREKLLRELND